MHLNSARQRRDWQDFEEGLPMGLEHLPLFNKGISFSSFRGANPCSWRDRVSTHCQETSTKHSSKLSEHNTDISSSSWTAISQLPQRIVQKGPSDEAVTWKLSSSCRLWVHPSLLRHRANSAGVHRLLPFTVLTHSTNETGAKNCDHIFIVALIKWILNTELKILKKSY